MIVSGWMLAGAYGLRWLEPAPGTPPVETGWERILGSLFVMLIAMLILGIVWFIGMMGAGDVKMQMGFGSWIGAFFGKELGTTILLYGFVVSVLVGGVLGLILMVFFRQGSQGLGNIRDVALDLMTLKSMKDVQDRAKERKKGQILLPYGIPLCIGFLSYLYYYLFTYLA
jgi:prepilin peptidase CpaA